MKKMLLSIFLFVMFFCGFVYGVEQDGVWVLKSWNDFDTSQHHFLGAGACTYTDQYNEFVPAIYGNFSIVGYKDWIKLDTGVACPIYKFKDAIAYRLTVLVGASTVLNDVIFGQDIEIGVYTGWSGSRNPWGIKVGIAF